MRQPKGKQSNRCFKIINVKRQNNQEAEYEKALHKN